MFDESRVEALRNQFVTSDEMARDALLLELYVAMTLEVEAAANNLRHTQRSDARDDVGRSLLALHEQVGTLAALAGAPAAVFEVPSNLDDEWRKDFLGSPPQEPPTQTISDLERI